MTPPLPDPQLDDAPLRLLLVDDDELDRATVLRALRAGGIRAECTEVQDASGALAAARAQPFDCVLLDYHLPGHDGLWVLRELLAGGADVPVVMLTGQGGEQVAVELMKAGASDYLAKAGLDAERLSRAVTHAVSLHRSRREAREAVEALRRSESRFRTLVASSTHFVWLTDAQGRPTPDSIGWSGFTGQSFEAMRWAWGEALHPEDRARVQDVWSQSLTDARPFEAEFRVRHRDGRYVWVRSSGVPHFDPDGTLTEWIGTITDITDQKLREEETRSRMEFEQQLVGIVSHDLRNPISAITMSTGLLLSRPGWDSQTLRLLERIRSSGERTLRMICDLLDFTQARLGGNLPIQPRRTDLHEVTQQAVEEARAAHPGRDIVLQLQGDGQGYWDADRLSQLLSNLIGNALAYSTPGTPVQVRSRGDTHDVRLEVHNQGEPIPAEVLPALFEPFKRGVRKNSKNGRSIGLGLYIVSRLVSAHHGTVEVASTSEAGTTFCVRLPRFALLRKEDAAEPRRVG